MLPDKINIISPGLEDTFSITNFKSSSVKNLSNEDFTEESTLCLIHNSPVAPICGLLIHSVKLSISFLVSSDLFSTLIQHEKSLVSRTWKPLPFTSFVISVIFRSYRRSGLSIP